MFPLKDNIPTDRFPIVTVAIIALNVFVYLFLQKHVGSGLSGLNTVSDANVTKWGAIPYEFTHPGKHCALAAGQILCEGQSGVHGSAPSQPNTWLTAFFGMFMHGGLLHIGGNMLFLWIFGNNVEDSMGRLKFLLWYLAGGVVAALAQFASGPGQAVPTLGASGAIAAVLGGYALLFPRARVVTLVFIVFFMTVITLPALLVLGLWFLLQILDASSQSLTGGGVAYLAHIGGFVFGLLVVKLLATRYDPNYDGRPRLPVY